MSWKSDKIPYKNWSIVTRSAWLFATFTSLTILSIIVVLYFSLDMLFNRMTFQFLSDESATILRIIHKYPLELQPLQQEVLWNPLPKSANRDRVFYYYIRVLDAKNKVMLETPEMNTMVGDAPFPTATTLKKMPRLLSYWKAANGNYYLLATLKPGFTTSAKYRQVQIALDVTYQHRILKKYWRTSLYVLLLSFILTILLSRVIARKSLTTLDEITDVAKNITSETLTNRLPHQNYPQELSHLAIAFNEMLNRIEVAFKRLQQCSNDLAHELRTPFNVLLGEAEIILSNPDRTASEYRRVIESSIEEHQKLLRLIENMLFLAQTEDPRVQLQKIEFDVRKEVEKIGEFFSPIAEENHITFHCKGKAEIHADIMLFDRVLNNLFNNAIQHMPQGGTITTTITENNRNIIILIEDTGVGIDQKHLPKLFDRFYRVNSKDYSNTMSTGLGLSIVRSIMDLHGGSIAIESELGTGARIILTFPK